MEKSILKLDVVNEGILEKNLEKFDKIEKLFNEKTSDITGELEFQLKVIPKNLNNNLFDESRYSDLKSILRNNTYGPSMIRDIFSKISHNLKASREGLVYIIDYLLDNTSYYYELSKKQNPI